MWKKILAERLATEVRWTLLIVRELLLLGPSRYTDLRNGLPGTATNLLADRLRELEEAGIVTREDAPPPIATALFCLTERGRALEPVVHALGRWAGPLMAEPAESDAFRSYWLAMPVKLHLTDHTPERPPVTIEVRTGDAPMLIEIVDGAVHARRGPAQNADAVLAGPPQLIMGVLTGRLDLAYARTRGVEYEGDLAILRRIQGPLPHADLPRPPL